MLTSLLVTGILHFLDNIPVDLFSMKQATLEWSELIAACIATDQVIDIRNTLHYVFIPIEPYTTMFG